MKRVLWFASLLLPVLCQGQSEAIRVGSIDFFATSGVDIAAVRAALPLHVGDEINEERYATIKQQVTSAVTQVLGSPPTDFALVCCSDGKGMIYIGLPGKNHWDFPHLPPPTGFSCLPGAAVDLYRKAMDALEKAVRGNDAAEDQGQGYALSHNPALRERQLAMREYALGHAALLQTALRECGMAENRQAAAQILGYGKRSRAQIAALAHASNDSDAIVRNNAVRTLMVMAFSGRKAASLIPAHSFVALLNSGEWTDRNKAGAFLAAVTKTHDRKLLSELRTEALDSLVEMARWHNPGHGLLPRVARENRRIRRSPHSSVDRCWQVGRINCRCGAQASREIRVAGDTAFTRRATDDSSSCCEQALP